MSKLQEIFQACERRRQEQGDSWPEDFAPGPPRPLRPQAPRTLITEIKRGSPSLGTINNQRDIVHTAELYAEGGASAVSVLTEPEYFQGSLEYLARLRSAIDLPLMRKDFLFHPRQLHEARAWGADGALLIAGYLPLDRIRDMVAEAHDLGMWILLEGHSVDDMKLIAECWDLREGDYVGINNRNLHNLELDVNHGHRVLQGLARDRVALPAPLIMESGFDATADVAAYDEVAAGFLIGSFLMSLADGDIAHKTAELSGRIPF
jgi:indole-3-glycerol phosphate synthase